MCEIIDIYIHVNIPQTQGCFNHPTATGWILVSIFGISHWTQQENKSQDLLNDRQRSVEVGFFEKHSDGEQRRRNLKMMSCKRKARSPNYSGFSSMSFCLKEFSIQVHVQFRIKDIPNKIVFHPTFEYCTQTDAAIWSMWNCSGDVL